MSFIHEATGGEEAEILDGSPHFYAPNPHMVDDKGPGGSQRRLMFGWVRGGQTPTKEVPYWDGNHSIPRVLTLDAGKLIQEPIPELGSLIDSTYPKGLGLPPQSCL